MVSRDLVESLSVMEVACARLYGGTETDSAGRTGPVHADRTKSATAAGHPVRLVPS